MAATSERTHWQPSVFCAVSLVLALLLPRAAPLHGQTLGELAKQEEERRRTVKEGVKVLTNKDLPSVPPSSAPSVPSATSSPPTSASDPGVATESPKEKKTPAEPVKDRAYWSGRLKALQAQLDRDQTYSLALQSQINALTTDFVNRDDPVQRAAIGRDRQKAQAELERLKEAIANHKKALAAFDEEARRAGVPPGWLR
jgi:hypothetical protein